MQYAEGGAFLAAMARRARKYYLGLVTITQDVADFLDADHGRTVLANAAIKLLHEAGRVHDRSPSSAAFQLSDDERQFLLGGGQGRRAVLRARQPRRHQGRGEPGRAPPGHDRAPRARRAAALQSEPSSGSATAPVRPVAAPVAGFAGSGAMIDARSAPRSRCTQARPSAGPECVASNGVRLLRPDRAAASRLLPVPRRPADPNLHVYPTSATITWYCFRLPSAAATSSVA